MKKFLIAVFLLLTTVFCLFSCAKPDTKPDLNITYYLDGNKVESVSTDTKAVAFIRPTDSETERATFDYSINAVSDGSKNQNVYLFSVDTLFDSYDELKASLDTLEYGKKYGIKSYYKDLGKGASVYEVTQNSSPKELTVVPLTVGDEKILTVEMYGAKGDGETPDNVAINKTIANKSANYIEFESSSYLQIKTINVKRSDLTLDGCGAVIMNRYDYVLDSNGKFTTNGTVSNDFVVSGAKTSPVKNVTIKNLELRCTEMRCVGSLHNRLLLGMHDQFSVSNVKNFTMDNCKMIVPERTGIGTGIVDSEGAVEKKGEIIHPNIDSITFSGKNENVTLKNCTMQNFAGGPQGIEINIHGGDHKNYVICNNYVEKNCHDEIFTIYGCEMFDGADIYGNTFKSHDEPVNSSPHPLGFGATDIAGNIKNVKFHNNTLDAVSRMDGMIFGSCENIEIYDNDFSIRPNTIKDTILYGFFRVPEPNKTTQTNIYIHDNKITIKNYKELPINYNCNKGFIFENNELDFINVPNLIL